MAESVSEEELEIIRSIKQRQQRINQIFEELDIKVSDITKQKSNQDQQDKEQVQQPSYFDKYADIQIQDTRQRYDAAIPGFKWLQMPFCKKLVIHKLCFCVPMSMLATWSYWLWYRTTHKLQQMPPNFVKKRFPIITAGLCIFSFFESLMLESYCNIDSYHYNTTISDGAIAKQAKKQFMDK